MKPNHQNQTTTSPSLHLRLTSIQAPNHDPMMWEVSKFLTEFFASKYAMKQISSSCSSPSPIKKVTFEFPVCERNILRFHHHHHHHHRKNLETTAVEASSSSKRDNEKTTANNESFSSESSSTTEDDSEQEKSEFLSRQWTDDEFVEEKKNNASQTKDQPLSSSAAEATDNEDAFIDEDFSCQQIDLAGSISNTKKQCACGANLLNWMQRAKLLEDGDEIQMGWFCGLPFVLAQYGYVDGIYNSKKVLSSYSVGSLLNINSGDRSSVSNNRLLHDEETGHDHDQSTAIGCAGVGSTNNETKQSGVSSSSRRMPSYTKDTPFFESNGSKKWLPIVAPRYTSQQRYLDSPFPCYFSDVIVRQDDKSRSTFDSLVGEENGTRWAYNEQNSQSGFNVTRDFLYRRMLELKKKENIGDNNDSTTTKTVSDDEDNIRRKKYSFAKVVQAGSHQQSIEKVLSNEIDAAAIDATVLETELSRDPQLQQKIRIIQALGPSPSPPFSVNTDGLKRAIRKQIFLQQNHHHSSSSVSPSLLEDEDHALQEQQQEQISTLSELITKLIQEALSFEVDDDDDDDIVVGVGVDEENEFKEELKELKRKRHASLTKFHIRSFEKVSEETYQRVREMLFHSVEFPKW